MPIIELDPIDGPLRDARNPVAILNGITAAMAVPGLAVDGVQVGRTGLVRLYFAFTGTVTGFAAVLWIRNKATGMWHRAAALSDLKTFSTWTATNGEFVDLTLSPGDEFYIQVTTLSGTTPSVTVYAAQGFATDPIIAGRQNLVSDTELGSVVALSDSMSLGSSPAVVALQAQWNGASYERVRAIESRLLYTAAARTASPTAVDQINYGSRGLLVNIKVTVASGAGVTFHIEGKDTAGGDYYSLLSSAAINAATPAGNPVRLLVYPGITEVANQRASYVLPRTFRVRAAHGDSASLTYSVSAELVP